VAKADEALVNDSGPVLRDIHLPPAAWWPLAPGWWIVVGLVLLATAVVAWWSWRRAGGGVRRAALREIDALAAAYARNGNDVMFADGASRLLRRVARVVEPGAASLAGEPWRAFLHQYARDAATQASLDRLLEARYLPRPALDVPAVLAALRAWCGNALAHGRRHAPDHTAAPRITTTGTPGEGTAS
jgi:hypothetical protein